ncbi:MAG: DnaB-like helicase C-terminal domain-containing protein [Chloroflexota bacterium]
MMLQDTQETNAEKALLCLILEMPEFFEEIVPALEPKEFGEKSHRELMAACKEWQARGLGRVPALELAALIDTGKIAGEYIEELRRYVPSLPLEERLSDASERWVAQVKEAAGVRGLKTRVEKVLKKVSGLHGLASDLITAALDSSMGESHEGFVPLSRSLPEFERLMESWRLGKPDDVEPTGFRDLDWALGGGLPKGNLAIIGARTSTFKTALGCQMAMNVIERCRREGGRVAFASLEMSALEVTTRLACTLARVDSKVGRMGKLNRTQLQALEDAKELLAEKYLPYLLIYDGLATSDFLRYQTLRTMARSDVRMLIVDFAELVADEGDSEHRRVVGIYRAARELAKLRNIPAVYLSQLNRSVEYDMAGTRVPSASNLMQGGEDVAATILLLYYPYGYFRLGQKVQVPSMFDYQGVEDIDGDDVRTMKERANKSRLYCIVAKGRFAGTSPVKLNVVPEFTLVTDYDPQSEKQDVVTLLAKKNRPAEVSGKDRVAGESDF